MLSDTNYDLLNHAQILFKMNREDLMTHFYNRYPATRFVNPA